MVEVLDALPRTTGLARLRAGRDLRGDFPPPDYPGQVLGVAVRS